MACIDTNFGPSPRLRRRTANEVLVACACACALLSSCSDRDATDDTRAGAGAGATSSAGRSGNAGASGAGDDAGTGGSSGTGVCPGWEMPAFDSLPRCVDGGCPMGPTSFECSQFRPSVIGGVPPPPPPSCAAVQCPEGTVCSIQGAQPSCMPPCDAPDGQCPAGHCAPGDPAANELGCVPPGCMDGAVDCGVVSSCDPTNPRRDAFGCARIACNADADCPCGVCEQDQCWERARRCFMLQFAP
jgi:hypothetical protein